MRYATLALLTVLPLAATASAQTSAPPAKARGSSPGIHAFAMIDGTSMAATDSFEAVFGT